MTILQKSSNALHIALWIAQIVLAASLIWASSMKLLQPIKALATLWPWAGEVPVALVKFTGIVDLLGAFGLILPSLLRIKPQLTPLAAVGIIALMVCASIFHISRGEISQIGVNIVFALMAVFIAWGRLKRGSITPK